MTVSRRAAIAGVLGVFGVGALAGCSSDSWAEGQADPSNAPGGQFAGDGSWGVYAPEERKAAVVFEGQTEAGETLGSAQLAGNVAVVNFWYAACPPCRVEARDLEALAQEHAAAGVRFVGVNVYDQPATVNSFNDEFGVSYPSILDVNSGSVMAAFAANVPPKAIPTTLVLDRQGRVAAFILGIADPGVLGPMITDVIAEQA